MTLTTLVVILFVLSFVLPWSWTKAMWDKIFCRLWARSSMKVCVEAGGKKLSSMKDKAMSDSNKPKEEENV